MDTKISTTLIVMAAGMGSRFGGLKQIEPIGKNGEIIIDFSIYDAKAAGFDKAVFVIKKEIEDEFREVVGKRIEKMIDVEYAFQDINDIPAEFTVPSDRTKPWGTTQAVLCTRDVITTPFAVINADDYYGASAFKVMHDQLVSSSEICMVAFDLEKTLTENGSVS
ncbi:MAG: sugar phosphate nucleotidyltransferase, partial [Oscillospiraceae bacterium]